jgi:hypothetical protein
MSPAISASPSPRQYDFSIIGDAALLVPHVIERGKLGREHPAPKAAKDWASDFLNHLVFYFLISDDSGAIVNRTVHKNCAIHTM